MTYMDSLSDTAKCCLYEYTKGSTIMTEHLVSAYGISTINQTDQTGYISGAMWEKIGLLISILYNAPLSSDRDLELYSFYKKGYNDFLSSFPEPILTPVRREEEMDGKIKTVPVIFTSTTTDKDVLPYLSPFHDERCCYRIIKIRYPFPILEVSGLSSYPQQHEVILPPFIILKNNSSYNTVMKEYNTDDLKACSVLEHKGDSHCRRDELSYEPYEQRLLNPKCLSQHEKIYSNLRTAVVILTTIPLDRRIVMYINAILPKNYLEPPCLHRDGIIHICNTIAISMVLFLSLVQRENNGRDDIIKGLKITILSSLFHNSGRAGQSGADRACQSSADIVQILSSSKLIDDDSIGIISENISTKATLDRFSYYAYKGADSIDISLEHYNPEENPFFIKYGNVLAANHTLFSEFKSFTSIIDIICSAEDLDKKYGELINRDVHFESDDTTYFYTQDAVDNVFIVKDGTVELQNNKRPLFKTCSVYPTEIIEVSDSGIPKMKKAVRELIAKLHDFFTGIRSLIRMFRDKKYLKNEARYFDDYWEILLAFLNFMPYTANELCKIIVPYEHRLLYTPV